MIPNTLKLQFRKPDRSEIEAIARVWHDGWFDAHGTVAPPAFSEHRTFETFVERTEAHLETSRVASEAGRILAFSRWLERELDQFYIAASARGSGLAARFLAYTEAEMARAGIQSAKLVCAAGNDRARRFYNRHGWQENPVTDSPLWTRDGSRFELPCHPFTKSLTAGSHPAHDD
ncbi:MAG: GNAT family N-acetyltransferase [Pseudomonadota bacterium]